MRLALGGIEVHSQEAGYDVKYHGQPLKGSGQGNNMMQIGFYKNHSGFCAEDTLMGAQSGH